VHLPVVLRGSADPVVVADRAQVLFRRELKVSRSLAKTLRNRGLEPPSIVPSARSCDVWSSRIAPGEHLDFAWHGDCLHRLHDRVRALGRDVAGGQLVGGLYGVSLGRVFFGESMFSVARDASKVALTRLVDAALSRGLEMIDCQVASEHLQSLGAREIPRREFRGATSDSHTGLAPGLDGGKPELHCSRPLCRIRAPAGRSEDAWRRKTQFRWKAGWSKPCRTRHFVSSCRTDTS